MGTTSHKVIIERGVWERDEKNKDVPCWNHVEKTKTQSWNIQEEDNKKDILSWKTYRNDKYNYEIKFPEEYSTLEWANAEKNEIIPVKWNSQNIYIANKPEMFLCCMTTSLSIKVLDTYEEDMEAWINNKIENR